MCFSQIIVMFFFFQLTFESLRHQTLKFIPFYMNTVEVVLFLISLYFQEGSESQASVRTRKYLGWVFRSQSGKSWTTPCCRVLALLSVRCCLRVYNNSSDCACYPFASLAIALHCWPFLSISVPRFPLRDSIFT